MKTIWLFIALFLLVNCGKDNPTEPLPIVKYEVKFQNLTASNPQDIVAIRLKWLDHWYVNDQWSNIMFIGEFDAGNYEWEVEYFLTGQEPNPNRWVWVPQHQDIIELDKDIMCTVFLAVVMWQ